jgi:hypothetical protein
VIDEHKVLSLISVALALMDCFLELLQIALPADGFIRGKRNL